MEISRNIKVVLCLCLLSMLIVGSVSADFSKLIEFSGTTYNTWTLGQDTVYNSDNALGISISDYNVTNQINGATNILFDPVGYVDFLVPSYATVTVAPLQLKVDSDVVATGTMYIKADSNGYELLELTLDNPVNMMGMTGFQVISPTVYVNGAWRAIQAKRTGENKLYVDSTINPEGFYLRGYYGSAYYMCGTLYYDRTVPYKAQLDINTTPYENYALSEIQLNRNISGIIYPSWFMVLDYIGNTYIASGNSVEEIEFTTTRTYPMYLNVSFGDDILLYTYSMTYYANSSYVVDPIVTPTITPTPTPEIPGCDVDISLALSKYTSIFPYEYITGTATIDGDLPSGSSIRWMIGPGAGSTISKDTFAVFTNQSGTWYVTRNDLGIVSGPTPTTYEDVLTEEVRFPDSGNYVVRVAVNTNQPCSVYDEKSLQVFPTSGVNLDFYGYDCLNGYVLGDMVMSIENLNITGPIVYTGNPIGVATNIGDILLINATSSGYTYSAFNYTVPNPPGGGTTLNVPVYLCPEEIGDIHPGNTTLVVNVKSQSTGEVIQGAYVSAAGSGVSIASDHTNSMGYVMLQIPYRAGSTKVDVTAFPYVSQSKYLPLNNATMYEETFWMLYSGTPTPTPTQTYNPNATYTTTPTRTMTTAPTTTITTYPKLVVEVTDSRYGYTVPIAGASVKLYDGDEVDQTYKGELIQTAITATNGRTDALQMTANAAYWIEVSKSGYYTSTERFRMSAFDSTRYVKLIPVGSNVTIATTSPTPGGNVYPDIGDGEATGWVAMFIVKVMELFGVNEWAARILLGLVATLIGAVFVGGCLAGFGSGEGAAMGALIGGCFGWVAACLLGFIPIWALIVSIAFVGMAFFVWHRAGGAGGG